MNEYIATHPSTLGYHEVTLTPLASCKMKSTNSDHSSIKQQQQQRRNGHQQTEKTALPHKLIDAPPYSSIYITSHGFEAPTCKHMNSPLAYKHGGKVDEEDDIDAEAEKFIQLKHKKFQLSKYSMSL